MPGKYGFWRLIRLLLDTGLTFRTGNIIVWYGLTWSLELYQQANARLHRQGQQRSVIIHHLVTEGTMDEDVMAALKGKAEDRTP